MTQTFTSIQDFYQNSGYAAFEQEHRKGGSFEVQMLCVEQDAHAMVDPPVPQLMLVGVVKASGYAKFDFGDGWKEHASIRGEVVDLQPAHQECRFHVDEPHEVLLAAIPDAVVRAKLDEVGIRGDPFEGLYGRILGTNGHFAVLRSMWRAMSEGGAANSLYVDGCMVSLLGMFCAIAQTSPSWLPPVLEDARLDRVVDFIEAHFAEPVVMGDLAKVAGMSTIQFSRAFKKAVGMTPHAFLTRRRLTQAKLLLRSSKLTITEVAFSSGFGSSAHFASVFSRKIGTTPSHYRQQSSR